MNNFSKAVGHTSVWSIFSLWDCFAFFKWRWAYFMCLLATCIFSNETCLSDPLVILTWVIIFLLLCDKNSSYILEYKCHIRYTVANVFSQAIGIWSTKCLILLKSNLFFSYDTKSTSIKSKNPLSNVFFFSFSSLIALPTTSITMLEKGDKSENIYLFHDHSTVYH